MHRDRAMFAISTLNPFKKSETARRQKKKIEFLRGGGMGAEKKSSQNAVFDGKCHDNTILKVQMLLSRMLLSLLG